MRERWSRKGKGRDGRNIKTNDMIESTKGNSRLKIHVTTFYLLYQLLSISATFTFYICLSNSYSDRAAIDYSSLYHCLAATQEQALDWDDSCVPNQLAGGPG